MSGLKRLHPWLPYFIIIVALFFVLSACSVGKKCVVTDEGNVVSSYVWFYKDKPAELDKMNCF